MLSAPHYQQCVSWDSAPLPASGVTLGRWASLVCWCMPGALQIKFRPKGRRRGPVTSTLLPLNPSSLTLLPGSLPLSPHLSSCLPPLKPWSLSSYCLFLFDFFLLVLFFGPVFQTVISVSLLVYQTNSM